MASRQAEIRIFETPAGAHLFVANGSRFYDISGDLAADARSWLAGSSSQSMDELARGTHTYVENCTPALPPVTSFSLNLAQICNMRCAYCYAGHGSFGLDPALMDASIAIQAVDRLLAGVPENRDVVLGFMGGEPLLHRGLLYEVVRYAVSTGRRIRFSLTTNGTLIQPSDAEFFARHSFHISISLDGDAGANDSFRVLNSGSSAYAAVQRSLRHLLAVRPRHLAARVTVTPRTGPLLPILDHLVDLGFDSVGIAPVLVSPDPAYAFTSSGVGSLLDQMLACGRKALDMLRRGLRYPFGNLETALMEIHQGTHRPYPCGAGAGYLSVSADGGLYSCHRTIGDERWRMGDLTAGPDPAARTAHLTANHVDRIEPCRSCWARYLCGGGCYHEVAARGRPACDYIRGWLEFCLLAYAELSRECPGYFENPESYFLEPVNHQEAI